jgi:HK97 family phage portal protein
VWPFRRKAAESPPEKKAASLLLPMGPAASALASTQVSYLTLASEGYAINWAAFSCINRIATAVASVEPTLYQRKKGKVEKVEDHPLLDLLHSPNLAQSRNEFMIWLTTLYLVSGNSYVYGNGLVASPNKPPEELQLLNPGKMTVERNPRGYLPLKYEYTPTASGTAFAYPVDQITGRSAVMHLKSVNPLNEWYGLSPLIAAAYGIDILNAGSKWNKKLLDNDARPSGALVVKDAEGKPATLTEEQFSRLREEIDSKFSGANNAGKPLLLEGGLEWQEFSLSPKDLDFLNGKYASARDVAMALGVPSQLLGIPGDSTFANMEQAKVTFWTDTVIPTLCLFLEGFNRWLTPLYGDDLYLYYDEEMIPALEPLRKQKADRINASGYMTVNEKRLAMGLDEIEGGDTVLVPSSTIPLELAGQVDLPEPGSEADEKPTEEPGEEEDDGADD